MITPLRRCGGNLAPAAAGRDRYDLHVGHWRFLLACSAQWRGLWLAASQRQGAGDYQSRLRRPGCFDRLGQASLFNQSGQPSVCLWALSNTCGQTDGRIHAAGLVAWVVSNELSKYTKHNRLKPVISFIIEKVPWINPSRWLYLNALAIKAMLCAFCPLSATRSSRNPEGIPASQRVKHPQR